MIHELRQYTLKLGKLPEYLEYARTIGRPARGNDYGLNHGYWTTEHGPLNQVWHLWSYDSLDERARLRAELQKNKAWTTEYTPRIRPLLERQDIRFIASREAGDAAQGRGRDLRAARLPHHGGRRAALGRRLPEDHAGAREVLAQCRPLGGRGAAAQRGAAHVELPELGGPQAGAAPRCSRTPSGTRSLAASPALWWRCSRPS